MIAQGIDDIICLTQWMNVTDTGMIMAHTEGHLKGQHCSLRMYVSDIHVKYKEKGKENVFHL